MNVDGIVHHTLVEAVHGGYLALAGREVGGIGLSGEVTCVTVALQAYGEPGEVEILAHLRKQAHTLGIVHLDVVQPGVLAMGNEQAGGRAFPTSQRQHRAGLQS